MQFNREQYIDLMTFGHADRPMFVELFGPLIGLDAEWRQQGASEDELSLVAFEWDFVPTVHCGGHSGLRNGLPEQLIEENDRYLVKRDALGRTVKLDKRTATIPLPIDFPVRTMDDWLRFKPMYEWHADRVDSAAVERARSAQAGGALVIAGILGGFDTVRNLMGEENGCMAYYDDPELIADIMQTLGDTAVAVLERVSDRVTIDQLSVHEDMAGKSGPLVGPEQVRSVIGPYYQRAWDVVRSRGTRMFEMDSDGQMGPVLDAFLDAGLTAIHPVEPAAGMDMVALRKLYGKRLAMKGGIDKFALARGNDAIRQELEYKLQPLMRAGGTVFGLDHRIPNGTPLAGYRYYVDLAREILGLPPRTGKERGWRRMAF